MNNQIQLSATLSEEAYNQIMQHLAAIQDLLPFLINFTNEDRKTYAKMGDKSVPFVGKSLDYVRNNKQLLPGFYDAALFEENMHLNRQLNSIYRPWRSIGEGLSDTIMYTGHQCYISALDFYNLVKMAKEKNIPGMTSIFEDLKARFPSRSKNRVGKQTKKGVPPVIDTNE